MWRLFSFSQRNWPAYSFFASTLGCFRAQLVTCILYAPSLRAKMPCFEGEFKHAE